MCLDSRAPEPANGHGPGNSVRARPRSRPTQSIVATALGVSDAERTRKALFGAEGKRLMLWRSGCVTDAQSGK